MLDLHCSARLSLVAPSRGYSLFVALRLVIVVASLVAECGLQDTQASVVAARRLRWHVGSSQTRDQTCGPCTGRRIRNH